MTISNKLLSVFQRDFALLILNLATGVLIARYLGVVALGVWAVLLFLPSYSDAFFRTKSDLAAVFFIGKEKYSAQDVLLNLNLIGLISVVIAIGVIFLNFELLYDFLFHGKSVEYRIMLQVFVIQIPLNFFFSNYAYFFIGHERVDTYNRMVLIQAGLNFFALIFLLNLTEFGLWSLIWGSIVGSLAGLLYALKVVNDMKMIAGKFQAYIAWDLVKHGFKFYISGFFGHFQQTGTNLITLHYLTLTQIAFLNQAQVLSKLLQKIVDPLHLILYPRITKKKEVDAVEISCVVFRVVAILMLMAGMVLAAISKLLIVSLYGDPFLPASDVLIILVPGVVVGGICGTLQNFFNGTGRFGVVPLAQFFPLIIQLLLAIFLVDSLGEIGVAYAISSGLFIYGFILVVAFLRITKISMFRLIPQPGDFNYLLNLIKKIKLSK